MSGPPPSIVERGRVGFLDKNLWLRWEANLHGEELDRWNRVRGILESEGPEFRAAAMNLLFGIELDNARASYRKSLELRLRRKADVLVGAGSTWKEHVGWYDQALSKLKGLEHQLDTVYGEMMAAWRAVDSRAHVLRMEREGLRRLVGPWEGWSWPGAETGRGTSRYDTPDGVATVKAEVRAAVQRRQGGATPPRVEAEEGPGRRRTAEAGPGLFAPPKK